MRYIDRTGCKMHDRGNSKDVKSLGDLTRTACKIAEEKKLGVMKTSWGAYKVIRDCGLGYCMDSFADLAEVDKYIKSL